MATIAMTDGSTPSTRPGRRDDVRLIGIEIAALSSIGAGAIHAGVIGLHAEQTTLARLFIAAAVFQIGWGIVALVRPSRWWAALGVVGNAAFVGGWLVTRVAGVSFIDGLEKAETAAFTDTACAALGLVAAGGALVAWMIGWQPQAATRSRRSSMTFPALAVLALTAPAMVVGAEHTHGNDHGASTAADGHDHGDGGEASATVGAPYDPTQPIDLGGVPGVSAAQQARAENLVAITLIRLPQWSDPQVAFDAGFRSIGDGLTGHEHYIQWDWINDDDFLNPDRPESLVYEVQPGGGRKLVSAMFMLPPTVALADVPDLGGALTQWHIHDDLCFTGDPQAPQVGAVVTPGQACPSGQRRFPPSPMIHVWITAHPCGPFAALEGVGAGQIAPGEERLCDHVHGSGF